MFACFGVIFCTSMCLDDYLTSSHTFSYGYTRKVVTGTVLKVSVFKINFEGFLWANLVASLHSGHLYLHSVCCFVKTIDN